MFVDFLVLILWLLALPRLKFHPKGHENKKSYSGGPGEKLIFHVEKQKLEINVVNNGGPFRRTDENR